MRKHSYVSPSLRQWLIVSSVQRDGNSLSPLIPFLYAVLPRGESKECVLPLLRQRSVCCRLLQQRSVCCRCCSKGVCVAAVAAKECVSHVVKGTVFQLFPQLDTFISWNEGTFPMTPKAIAEQNLQFKGQVKIALEL
jgi:hypothetical protein